jgi:hypothetical protein
MKVRFVGLKLACLRRSNVCCCSSTYVVFCFSCVPPQCLIDNEYRIFVLRNVVVDVRICAVLHPTSILLVTTARRLVRTFFAETRQLHLLVIE